MELINLRKFIFKQYYLSVEELNSYINYYIEPYNSIEEINEELVKIKEELESNLMYDEVEDSVNGGETSCYDKNKSKIEVLEDFKYISTQNNEGD